MDGLITHFIRCLRLSGKVQRGALELLDLLKFNGGILRKTDLGPVDKKPERKIDAKGNIIGGIGVEHELLGKAWLHNKLPPPAPKLKEGAGSVSYIQDTRQVTIYQSVDKRDVDHWRHVADGQLAFARMLYPLLRPRFGWIDEFGAITAKNVLLQGKPRFFCWANFYGPKLVEQIGKDFLLNAPGWKAEELDDGGIVYVVEEHFDVWHSNPSKSALEYLRTKMPHIGPYRARQVELPGEIARMVQIDDTTGAETVVYERPRKKTLKNKKRADE